MEPAVRLPDENLRRDDWAQKRNLLPDGSYLRRVVVRQRRFVLTLMILVVACAFMLSLSQKNIYSSSVSAVFDPRDSSEVYARYPNYPTFAQLSHRFYSQFQDREFLGELATITGVFDAIESKRQDSPAWKVFLREKLDKHLPKSWKKPMEEKTTLSMYDRAAIIDVLRQQMETQSNDKNLLLTLVAYGETAEDAQRLAAMAMDLFIKRELEREADRVTILHDVFSEYVLGNFRPDTTETREKRSTGDHKNVNVSEEMRLKHEEADLLDKIQMIKTEVSDAFRQRGTRRAELEAQLNSLSTRLQPSHPLVIAKQEELMRFTSNDDTQPLRARLNAVRQALSKNRSEQRRLGIVVSAREELSPIVNASTSANTGQFMPVLSDRLGELSLEKLNISRQANSPSMRTRLRLMDEASLNPLPYKNNKRALAISFVTLGLFVVFGLGALREFASPLARDGWRIAGQTSMTSLGEISWENRVTYPRVSPELADEWRRDNEHNYLAEYEQICHALRHACLGNTVLFVPVGEDSATASFAHNLANVFATESIGPILLMDFDHHHSVAAATEEFLGDHSIPHYLLKQARWDDVCKSRHASRAYELVPAPDQYTSRVARAYHSPILAKLFVVLSRRYQTVLSRGMSGPQMIENATLQKYTSDTILVVDAEKSTYADLKRLIDTLDQRKVRGFVLLGG